MSKPDSTERVRPIPIEDDDPAQGETASLEREPSRAVSALVPLTIVGMTLIVVALVVLGFGAVEVSTVDELAEPTDFSSTPRSDSSERQLLISAASENSGWMVVWDSTPDPMSIGSIGAIPAPSTVYTNPEVNDAGGSFVAANRCFASRCGVSVARADRPNETLVFVEADTFTWHSDDPLALAWIDAPGERLATASIDPDTGQLVNTTDIPLSEDNLRLVRWDTNGFVLTGERTVALDDGGSLQWSHGGRLLDVDASVATVARPSDWAVVDRIDGTEVVIVSPKDGLLTVVNTKAGNARSEITESGYTYSLDLLQPASARAQTLAPNLRHLPIESGDGASYRVFRGNDDGSISVVYQRPTSSASTAEF